MNTNDDEDEIMVRVAKEVTKHLGLRCRTREIYPDLWVFAIGNVAVEDAYISRPYDISNEYLTESEIPFYVRDIISGHVEALRSVNGWNK